MLHQNALSRNVYKSEKVMLDPHPESDQHQNLVTSTGSPVAHTIPYHPGRHGLNLLRTMLRPIKMTQCASPAGMGRKDRECIQV